MHSGSCRLLQLLSCSRSPGLSGEVRRHSSILGALSMCLRPWGSSTGNSEHGHQSRKKGKGKGAAPTVFPNPEEFVDRPGQRPILMLKENTGSETFDSRMRRSVPCVYGNEVQNMSELRAHSPCLVDVQAPEGQVFGTACFNHLAPTCARLISENAFEIVDSEFLGRKIRAALQWRKTLGHLGEGVSPGGFPGEFFGRLVNGDGDGLPGFFVDAYGISLSVQIQTAGAELLIEAFLPALAREWVRACPTAAAAAASVVLDETGHFSDDDHAPVPSSLSASTSEQAIEASSRSTASAEGCWIHLRRDSSERRWERVPLEPHTGRRIALVQSKGVENLLRGGASEVGGDWTVLLLAPEGEKSVARLKEASSLRSGEDRGLLKATEGDNREKDTVDGAAEEGANVEREAESGNSPASASLAGHSNEASKSHGWTTKDPLPRMLTVRENGCLFQVDAAESPRTGFVFDRHAIRKEFSDLVSRMGPVESEDGEKTPLRVLDLYAHVGAFGIEAARTRSDCRVLCVETQWSSVTFGRVSASLSGVEDQVRFEKGDALRLLEKEAQNGTRFDAVVLDPPDLAPVESRVRWE